MLVTTERLVWVECVRSRIFRGSLQFAVGFCSSPLTASPSCSRHHIVPSFVLSTFNSHHNSGAAVTRSFRPLCFNSSGTPKFRGRCTPKRDLQKRVLWEFQLRAGFSVIGRPVQMHGEGLLRLHRKVLGRRTQSNQVLGVECTERYQDIGPDPDDAFFHAWPKYGDPKLAAKQQLGTAHGRRTTGMGHAVLVHLLDCRGCIIHASPTRSVTIFVHLHPTTRVYGRLDVNLLAVVCLPGSDFHLYKNPPCARLCGLLTGA